MNFVTDALRQLVQRRLWPIALLLLGALVAVPFVLSKPAATPSAPAPATTTAKTSTAASDPIVAMVADEGGTSARRVLGKRHDPFASSAPATKKKKATTTSTTTTATTTTSPTTDAGSADSQTTQTSSSGEGTSSAGTTSASPTPTSDTSSGEDTTTVPAGSIDIRFGSSSDEKLPRQTLARLEALPSADEPVVVYMGTKDNGKTARFMLGDGVTATGDGDCKPADTCETIELKAGETEFLTVAGDEDSAEFELDLVKIHRHETKVPSSQVVDDTSSTTQG